MGINYSESFYRSVVMYIFCYIPLSNNDLTKKETVMEEDKVFKFDNNSYVRGVDPVKQYVEQMAVALSTSSGDDVDKCKTYIVNKIKSNSFPKMRNPEVEYLHRKDNGDREILTTPLSRYLSDVAAENLVIAPSGTCYLHPKKKSSLLVGFLEKNVKNRGVFKKLSARQRSEGNMTGYVLNDTKQKTFKRSNNSISGAFASRGTGLFNPSAHYTLTSTTRTVTSLGNANTERMSGGNRHYRNKEIAINNIVSIMTDLNEETFSSLVKKYNLTILSVDDVMDMVYKSSNRYWNNSNSLNEIRKFVEKMTGLQRSYFGYIGDLYTLKKHNSDMFRELISNLSAKKTGLSNDPIKQVRELPGYVLNLAHHICIDDIIGYGDRYEDMHSDNKLDLLVSTGINSLDTLNRYSDLINQICLSNNMPPSIAYVRDMIRDVTVLSDTDSTCASYDQWTTWYSHGKLEFGEIATAVSASVMTLVTQSIQHGLNQLTVNMNADRARIGVLAMKNEFYWDVLVTMNVSKHYFGNVRIIEGSVLKEPDLELKGVHLIGSNVSRSVIDEVHNDIRAICKTVTSNKKIDLIGLLHKIAGIERNIKESVLKGDKDIFRQGKMKNADSYKKGEKESPYQNHLFWNDVFRDKYGNLDEPPYSTIKINTTVTNVSSFKRWLEQIEDLALRGRLLNWMKDNNKTSKGVIHLAMNYVDSKGIPDEIKLVIDVKKIVLDNCSAYYTLLESLGYIKKEGYTLDELGF